jgi:hypothetical protein
MTNKDYDNGQVHAMTMGAFLQILIDSGNSLEAVLVSVTADEQPQLGQFIRHWRVLQVPNGQIKTAIQQHRPQTIHKFLVKLLQEEHLT